MKTKKKMSRQQKSEAPVTFYDVVAYFTEVEWNLLQEWQNELYKNVMKEIQHALTSLGPVIATSVFSLRVKEKEPLYYVDHQDSERRHSDMKSLSATVSNSDMFMISSEENEYLKNSQNTDGRESNDHLCTADTIENAEVLIKIKEVANQDTDRREINDSQSTGHETTIPNISFCINEKGESYAIAHNDSDRRHIGSPAGFSSLTTESEASFMDHIGAEQGESSTNASSDLYAAMKSAICFLLLVTTVRGFLQDDSQRLQQRLYEKLEKFCDDMEDFTMDISRKRKSLEGHAASFRLIADEMDKVHKQVTEDVVFWSGVGVGGNLITITGAILDALGKGSPVISTIGQGISLCGSYIKENICSSEQEHNSKYENLVDKIFKECEQDLQESIDLYHKMEERLKDLEEDLQGSIFHKKLFEIKRKLSHFKPSLEKKFFNLKHELVNFVVKLAMKSGAIPALKETLKDLTKKPVTIEPLNGVSKEIAVKERHMSGDKYVHIFTGVVAATNLYQDGKEMYKGIIHLNEGARSELAEKIREVATYLEVIIRKLNHIIPKENKGSKS